MVSDGPRFHRSHGLRHVKRLFGVHDSAAVRRRRLLAVITDLASAARFLRHRGEPTEPPTREHKPFELTVGR